jgi:hypothetical protein
MLGPPIRGLPLGLDSWISGELWLRVEWRRFWWRGRVWGRLGHEPRVVGGLCELLGIVRRVLGRRLGVGIQRKPIGRRACCVQLELRVELGRGRRQLGRAGRGSDR